MPSADQSHLNLTINPLIRQIDTMMEKYNVGEIDVKILMDKVVEVARTIQDYPDLDIPNDVFVGVSNGTRKLAMVGLAVIISINAGGIKAIQNIIKDLPPEDNN